MKCVEFDKKKLRLKIRILIRNVYGRVKFSKIEIAEFLNQINVVIYKVICKLMVSVHIGHMYMYIINF